MIEINLLPEEFRIKTRNKSRDLPLVKNTATFSPEQIFIYAIPALLGLFIFIHAVLGIAAIVKNIQLGSLNQQLIVLAPQKKTLDAFNKEFSTVSADANFVQSLNKQRILWAKKLNKLSLYLPSGVWFTDIKLNNKGVSIQGSVISLENNEVGLINKLLGSLKADTDFSGDFVSLELNNVQERNSGGYDIADFTLSGNLLAK